MSYDFRWTRADLKRRTIPINLIENNVAVMPGLQVNEMSLQEHNEFLRSRGEKPLNDSERKRMHPDE